MTIRSSSLVSDLRYRDEELGLTELVRRTRLYQMRTRSAGSSHMPSPGLTANAVSNKSTLRTMPLVRHSAGECGSI